MLEPRPPGRLLVRFEDDQPTDDSQLRKEPPVTLASLTERLKWELEIEKVRARYNFYSYTTTVIGVTIFLLVVSSIVLFRASTDEANYAVNVVMSLVKLWAANYLG
jgi:hypothetical protein